LADLNRDLNSLNFISGLIINVPFSSLVSILNLQITGMKSLLSPFLKLLEKNYRAIEIEIVFQQILYSQFY